MNINFIKKIIRSEMLKYEAIKEILPRNLKDKVDAIEKDTINIIKDIALEIIKIDTEEKQMSEAKNIKKVNIDFN